MNQIANVVAVLAALLFPASVRADGVEKWFFAYVDLLRDKVSDSDRTNYTSSELTTLLDQLKCHGYSVIVLSSFQLGDDQLMDPDSKSPDAMKVQANLKAIGEAASKKGMSIIPEVMPVGASESILARHRHLAEATPVREMTFEVKRTESGQLQAMPSDRNLLLYGNFGGPWDEVAEAWGFPADRIGLEPSHEAPPGTKSSLEIHFGDNGVSGGLDLNARQRNGDDSFQSWHPVKPWHQYRLSFSVRTIGLEAASDGEFGFYVKVSGRLPDDVEVRLVPLERVNHAIKATQGWTTYSTILNSYEFDKAELWLGFAPLSEGHAYITNVRLQEIGGANMIRRDNDPAMSDLNEGLPTIVRVKDTDQELREGTDFARWDDTLVCRTGWFLHEHSGTPIQILNDTLEDKHLVVSYYHAALPDRSPGYVCCSLRHPKVFELFRLQVSRIQAVLQPTRWLINHDEIRAMGHDPLAKGDSPAVILKGNLSECIKIIKATTSDNPGIIVFSDMYDPHHNAIKRDKLDETGRKRSSFYPMVNGDLDGSWIGLDNSITILNWQTASKQMTDDDLTSWQQSLLHFSDLETPQVISGFYDVVPGGSNPEQAVRDRAEKIFKTVNQNGIQPVTACYYSTKRNHSFTKVFAEAANRIDPLNSK